MKLTITGLVFASSDVGMLYLADAVLSQVERFEFKVPQEELNSGEYYPGFPPAALVLLPGPLKNRHFSLTWLIAASRAILLYALFLPQGVSFTL